MGLRSGIWLMKWARPVPAGRRVDWLLRPAPRSWQAVSLVILLSIAVSTSLRENWGSDNAFVVKAADALLSGASPYEDKRFLYLPSAVIMAVPEALLPHWALRWLLPLGMTALIGVEAGGLRCGCSPYRCAPAWRSGVSPCSRWPTSRT